MSDYSHLPRADSAGISFSGRTLGATPFAGDTGETPAGLRAALQALGGEPADPAARASGLTDLVAALAGTRVFVPVVAVLGETAAGARGVTSDKNADMALVTVAAPDGRTALPIFTSVADLAAWNASARPIPVEAERAALSAVSERCDVMVVNPGSDAAVISRTAMWALARGLGWVPSFTNPAVLDAIVAALAPEPAVLSHACGPGRSGALRLTLTLVDGLNSTQVNDLVGRVQSRLSEAQAVADGVDGLEVTLRSGGTR
ncbi:SseB family protein [Micrococcales bacterium 31B]|nr:SseB family protein [Micrococcales bacterium 31B]